MSPRPTLATMMRLIRASELWVIEFRPDLECWTAEQVTGSQIRYLAAHSTTELADAIDAAEGAGR